MQVTTQVKRAVLACGLVLALGACEKDRDSIASITAPPDATNPDDFSRPGTSPRCRIPGVSEGDVVDRSGTERPPCPQ